MNPWVPVKLANGDTMYIKDGDVEKKMNQKKISAQIICDSTNWLDKRLTTFILEYPRYIHAELMTHRVFSKNSASSRAIPINKMINSVVESGVVPKWTLNKSGMQGDDLTDENKIVEATNIWNQIKMHVVQGVSLLSKLGIHKQNANRPLEAFQYIKIILTGTEFDNFFALRDHKDAHPEIQELAREMRKAHEESLPIFLEEGQWHIPFSDRINDSELFMIVLKNTPMGFGADREIEDAMLDAKLKISVARCARVSYNNFEGKIDYEDDFRLFNDLLNGDPLHASPSEHQAQVPYKDNIDCGDLNIQWIQSEGKWKEKRGSYFSNLVGWIQLRKLIEIKKYAERVQASLS